MLCYSIRVTALELVENYPCTNLHSRIGFSNNWLNTNGRVGMQSDRML
jgi:hypothetical protein